MISANEPPSGAATLERAFSLANEAMWMVALQVRRTRTSEPEDNVFVIRRWADLQFLIVALRRVRRTAELAGRVPLATQRMQMAIATFDATLPVLMKMRNVSEHFDAYALDSSKRRHNDVDRRALQVSSVDGSAYEWLGGVLDTTVALAAATALFGEVRAALTSLPPRTVGEVAGTKSQTPP